MIELIGKRLGEFEIIRQLGRGGMGIVFEAIQTSLNRRVALKVLGPGLGLTPPAVDRFRREAAAAAKLHHTNIVPVYATGEDNGIHFYAMELIEGPSLDAVIREMRGGGKSEETKTDFPTNLAATGEYIPSTSVGRSAGSKSTSSSTAERFDRAAAMIADVANALDHAHRQGITHRDIKPSNLLLSADGRLSVTDFGLARMLEQPGMTVTGEFLGTPAYMSPEQVTAGRIKVDHRTDVYSLGATLYELLTLSQPFVADGREKLLAMVTQKEPPWPRSIDAKVPRDLETICLKCLEKDPDRRYQTAKEMGDDLRRYVNRFAILAKRTGPLTRIKKWVKRNPAVTAVGLTALLAFGTAAFFAWRLDSEKQHRLEQEQARADELNAEKRRAAIERAMAAALAVDLTGAERAVVEAEQLGASLGETHLLRGFIALYSGRADEAVIHLEETAKLMPGSVSARALLANAHAEAADWTTARRVVDEAAAMTPRTPEDKLFLGQAYAIFVPGKGLQLMDQALAERPSGIGHVLRADARSTLASDTGSQADADAAVVEAELAKRLLPGNPFPISIAAFAHVASASAYRHSGRADLADEQLAAAAREAEELAHFPGNYGSFFTRYCINTVRDGLDNELDMLADLREIRAKTPTIGLAYLEAYNLYCLGREAEAALLADQFPNDRSIAPLRVLIALAKPDGRTQARQAWERIGGAGQMSSLRLEAAPMILALGEPGDRITLAREIRAEVAQLRHTSYSLSELAILLKFLEGKSSEQEFLAQPVDSNPQQCRRQYWVGWQRLGAGDRVGAAAAFQEAYKLMMPRYQFYWASRAILIRMKDPNWPQAIPAKK
jgi:serine/threonine protein kinase